MALGRLGGVIRQLRALGPDEGASDAQLVERFLAGRDPAAFEALVRRHGPMVLGTCRRVLGNLHDAEDAFQATFLVLARKAASVRRRGSLGGWLYQVAQRTALHARQAGQRRRAREARVMPRQPDADGWDEVREALDHELDRLPEGHREVLVLCDLEGRTRKEAAARLGLAEGTVASRLARARQLLARRLGRHGIALSGGALATLLVHRASAAVPAPLVSSTVQAATLVAAGHSAATPAAALMKEVLKTMLVTKLKAVVMTLVVVVLGASGLVFRASGQSAPNDPRTDGKPRTELEALKREVELLRFNLEVVLEKCRAQEDELHALRRAHARAEQPQQGKVSYHEVKVEVPQLGQYLPARALVAPSKDVEYLTLYQQLDAKLKEPRDSEALKRIEQAIKAWREAQGEDARRKAAEALEKAARGLRETNKQGPKKN